MKPIKTWNKVDGYIAKLGLLDFNIDYEGNERDRLCQEIKKKYNGHIKDYEAAKKDILETLESFFVAHKDDPEVKGKTYEGPYGKCGLRLTPPSVKPIGKMTWERVFSRILELGYKTKFLRPLVHTIKDIDRELLATDKVNDDLRKEIGVKLHQEERFWYEAK
jgi:phage host-nuclease inhibitor protein Gam